jgi:hypothetical protein
MDADLKKEFLHELEREMATRRFLDNGYQSLHIALMTLIAVCGFLTAAASQSETKTTFISQPTSLLTFGLISAVCAIVNQVLKPAEKNLFHKQVKKALQYIRGEVKYGDMAVKDAQNLMALAITSPELVLRSLPSSSGQAPKQVVDGL